MRSVICPDSDCAVLASAHAAFVNGMDLALLVSGATALAGLALTLAFLPQTSTAKTTDQPARRRRGHRDRDGALTTDLRATRGVLMSTTPDGTGSRSQKSTKGCNS